MHKILFLFFGLFLGALPIAGQSLEADRQLLFEGMPVVHKMQFEGFSQHKLYTSYKFVQGNYRYKRVYMYLSQKICYHTFSLERDGKRYLLKYTESHTPTFHTEIYSDEKKEWVKSKEVECSLDKLPYNMRHTIRIDQGTLGSYSR